MFFHGKMADTSLTSHNDITGCNFDEPVAVLENFKSVHKFDSFATISLLGSGGSLGFNALFKKQHPHSEARTNRGRKLQVFSLRGFSQKSFNQYSSQSGEWQKSVDFPITMSNTKFLSITAIAKNRIPQPVLAQKRLSCKIVTLPLVMMLLAFGPTPATISGYMPIFIACFLAGFFSQIVDGIN